VVLAAAVYRARTIWPGILIHSLNNLVFIAHAWGRLPWYGLESPTARLALFITGFLLGGGLALWLGWRILAASHPAGVASGGSQQEGPREFE